MLYYKFLNDKKGDLSQIWIASQSPSKVSKRVILDISISSCCDDIAGKETVLPLRMRALLLLGLSRIIQKKAQLLVADCLRIQNAIGDVMCLTSNDLPKDLLSANDQQITLQSSSAAKTALDVDLSFEQGDLVDRWIEANFEPEQVGHDSLSGSYSSSFSETIRGMGMGVDMLERYTVHSMVDDLLPEATNTLIPQEVDIETRRGDGGNTSLGLLHVDDSLDLMDGGMEIEPLSGDSSIPGQSTLLLKPFEPVIQRKGQRKRTVPLDKSLELPLTGVIMSRNQLKDMLTTACSKRQRMNHHQLLLLDMNKTNHGYSSQLETLLNSHCHLEEQQGRSSLVLQQQPLPDFDNMDFDAPMDLSMDDGNVTLGSIHPLEDSEDHGDNNNPVEGENLGDLVVVEKEEYTHFIKAIQDELDKHFVSDGKRELSWNEYTMGKGRHEGASQFYNLLIAASERELNVSQQQPFCDITVSL